MKINEYQKLAKVTVAELGEESENFLHMDMGMVTEIGEIIDIYKKKLAYGQEIDMVNLGEEFGDLLWYVVNKCTFAGVELEDEIVTREKMLEVIDYDAFKKGFEESEMSAIASSMIDMMAAVTGRTPSAMSRPYIMILTIMAILSLYDIDIEDVMERNINKLKARYGEKFDAAKALNRDLDAEREQLGQ